MRSRNEILSPGTFAGHVLNKDFEIFKSEEVEYATRKYLEKAARGEVVLEKDDWALPRGLPVM